MTSFVPRRCYVTQRESVAEHLTHLLPDAEMDQADCRPTPGPGSLSSLHRTYTSTQKEEGERRVSVRSRHGWEDGFPWYWAYDTGYTER